MNISTLILAYLISSLSFMKILGIVSKILDGHTKAKLVYDIKETIFSKK